jgi:predicted SprT family Zn-dependent metalloprotease
MPRRWKKKEGDKLIHEIVINPENIAISDMEWHQTLVHEMVHLWQEAFGKPSRACYHNKEWAAKMESIGLMPSTTGKPGGEKTGQGMSDYPIEDGLFQKVFLNIGPESLKNLILPFIPNYRPLAIQPNNEQAAVNENIVGEASGQKEKKMGVKKKYTCSCGNKVWGRSGMIINCGTCDQPFVEHLKEKV